MVDLTVHVPRRAANVINLSTDERKHKVGQIVLSAHRPRAGPRPLSIHLPSRPGTKAPGTVRALRWPEGRNAPLSLNRARIRSQRQQSEQEWLPLPRQPGDGTLTRPRTSGGTPRYALPLAKAGATPPRRPRTAFSSNSTSHRLHVPTYLRRGATPPSTSRSIPTLPRRGRGFIGAYSRSCKAPSIDTAGFRTPTRETSSSHSNSPSSAPAKGPEETANTRTFESKSPDLNTPTNTVHRKRGTYKFTEMNKLQIQMDNLAIETAWKNMRRSQATTEHINAVTVVGLMKKQGKKAPSDFWLTFANLCDGKEHLKFQRCENLQLSRLASND